jgi:hypothetical protein
MHMKKVSRLLSILIMAMIIATPFLSFATEEGSFDASGNSSEVTAAGDESGGTGSTEAETESTSAGDTEAAAEDTKQDTPVVKDKKEDSISSSLE